MPLTWADQSQNSSPSEIAASPFQLVVVDRDMWDPALGAARPHTAAEVSTMEGGAVGSRLVLSYMSIGQASPWRDYWDPAWESSPPSWLGPRDPNWGSYWVRYWDPGWQGITDQYVDKILAAGFGGAFLDVVDCYLTSFVKGEGRADAAADMIAFADHISDYAKAKDPGFKVYVNNAEGLLSASGHQATYLSAIDGVNKESLYYNVAGAGQKNDQATVDYSLSLLKLAQNAGKTLINIEYLTDEASITDVLKRAGADGLAPYIADWGLATLDRTGTSGADSITGGSGANRIHGLAGNDILVGGAGNDVIYGGSGDDRIDGGPGDDRLTGGVGADVFRFGPAPTGRDTIADFQTAVRGEVIEFSSGLIPGVKNFGALQPRISEDANQNAVIDLGGGSNITLLGVRKPQLRADDFDFL